MSDEKQRHGCLTAWLLLIIVANAGVALLYMLGSAAIRHNLPNLPTWFFPLFILGAIANIVFAIGLFRWKKWAFWGALVMSLIIFIVNLSLGINVVSALLGLAGIAILYLVLQIGGEKKGWTQLE